MGDRGGSSPFIRIESLNSFILKGVGAFLLCENICKSFKNLLWKIDEYI